MITLAQVGEALLQAQATNDPDPFRRKVAQAILDSLRRPKEEKVCPSSPPSKP